MNWKKNPEHAILFFLNVPQRGAGNGIGCIELLINISYLSIDKESKP